MDQHFCPNCGSTNVEPDQRKTNMLGEIISNPNKWLCNECNYTGLMPKGDHQDYEEDIKNIEFDENKQPAIDTDLGNAYRKYLIYISIPLTILYILAQLI
ncbi:MAG: hypothetical protein ACI977_000352 [Candidatus Nanohaloarchaea archaeon]|jgi:predicted nucleic-acid-binding Zn-ribbon protein